MKSRKPPGAISARQILTIATLIFALVAVVIMKGRCGKAVEGMFKALDPPPTHDGG